MTELTKRCGTCKETKGFDAFHRNKTQPDGRHHQCKECTAAKNKRYAAMNPGKIRAAHKKWTEENALEREAYNRGYSAALSQAALIAKSQPLPDQQIFTIVEAAAYLRISRATVYRLFNCGDLKFFKVGGRALVRKADMDELVEKGLSHD